MMLKWITNKIPTHNTSSRIGFVVLVVSFPLFLVFLTTYSLTYKTEKYDIYYELARRHLDDITSCMLKNSEKPEYRIEKPYEILIKPPVQYEEIPGPFFSTYRIEKLTKESGDYYDKFREKIEVLRTKEYSKIYKTFYFRNNFSDYTFGEELLDVANKVYEKHGKQTASNVDWFELANVCVFNNKDLFTIERYKEKHLFDNWRKIQRLFHYPTIVSGICVVIGIILTWGNWILLSLTRLIYTKIRKLIHWIKTGKDK